MTSATCLETVPVRTRLLRALGATALGPAITAVVQLVNVPAFLTSWGTSLYGEWILLSSIPSYLAFSDIGFGSVAANDMTMRVATGDRAGALETFQSTWCLITVLSAILCTLLSLAVSVLPLHTFFRLASLTPFEARTVIVLLSCYALVSLQSGLLMSGFRCEGNFAYGQVLNNGIRLAETAGVFTALALHAHPISVAAVMLLLRIAGTLVMLSLLHRRSPWLRMGSEYARIATMRRLARPAFAYLGFPVGTALSIQGMVVVVGALLGPVAVVTFSAMRTVSRLAMQVVEVVKNSVWPELSAAYGTGNQDLARRLHRAACKSSLWLSTAALIFLAISGEHVVSLWTRGRVTVDHTAFRLLLFQCITASLWYTSTVVSIASNTHERVAGVYLAGSLTALLIAWMLIPRFGLSGVGISLLSIDIITSWYVLRHSLRALGDRLPDFAGALVSPRYSSL